MNLPIEMFVIGIGISLMFVLLGFFRQIPYMLIIGGMLLLVFAVTTDIIILSHVLVTDSEDTITYHYEVDTVNDEIELDDDGIIVAEYVSNSSSILIGDTVNCIDLVISIDEGSPTGNAVIGVFDSTGNITLVWANPPISSFADLPLFYTYCFTDYTIQNGDRIGLGYDSGTMDDTLWVHTFDPSPFNGYTTRAQSYTISGGWGDVSVNEDLTMRLYFVEEGEPTEHIEQVTYQFSEFPKVLFALFGVLIMLMSLMIWRDGA